MKKKNHENIKIFENLMHSKLGHSIRFNPMLMNQIRQESGPHYKYGHGDENLFTIEGQINLLQRRQDDYILFTSFTLLDSEHSTNCCIIKCNKNDYQTSTTV
jgi:hypothetical protein